MCHVILQFKPARYFIFHERIKKNACVQLGSTVGLCTRRDKYIKIHVIVIFNIMTTFSQNLKNIRIIMNIDKLSQKEKNFINDRFTLRMHKGGAPQGCPDH